MSLFYIIVSACHFGLFSQDPNRSDCRGVPQYCSKPEWCTNSDI